MWPRCANCKHVAECHDYPPPEGSGKCDGDFPGMKGCECTGYTLPEGWVMVDELPIREIPK